MGPCWWEEKAYFIATFFFISPLFLAINDSEEVNIVN
jgi:hypothetical protein